MAAFTEEQVKDFSIKNWYDLSGQVAVVTGGATGLGLAIVRRIVVAHGGTIHLNSTVGKGREFQIYLPLLPAPRFY